MRFAVLLIQLALAQSPTHSLLDVPFVSQTPELCGGAAVSMVLRYWGQRDVFPQDFAPLVSRSDGGIFTGVLATAVSDRGWTALVEPASVDTGRARVRAEIDRGRPIIALIEVAPRAYHYVVIVGSTDTEVVFHDPARAPFRVLDWAAFDRAWSAANRWMMVALPPAGFVAATTPPDPPAAAAAVSRSPATPCSALVAHAVETALAGQAADAEQKLAAAMRLCPADPAAWREMAGLRFSQSRWSDANQLASTATRLAPDDSYAWELVATSRYLMGDPTGALAAWNHIGQPRIDAINVHGAERTHLPVVVRALGLPPRERLTSAAFTQAVRRLRDVPVMAAARMTFEPVAGGLANVDVAIVERAAWPRRKSQLLTLGARAALQREVRVDIAGLAGAGESAFAAWRFSTNRPRVMAGLAFPSPRWLPGVTTFSAVWDRQSYRVATGSADGPFRETRRRAGLQLSDWASGWLKWQIGAALDRFNDADFFTADAALMAQSGGDRAAVIVSAASWLPAGDGRRFMSGGVSLAARSTVDAAHSSWSGAIEFQRVGAASPLALWAGAGTGPGRNAFLRAHDLLERGVITGSVLGRELVNGTLEYSRPLRTIRTAAVSLAGFVDAARASRRRTGLEPTPLYVDVGAGLRIHVPGSFGGVRLDVAHGLNGGRTTLSGGWIAAWPR